MLEPQVLLVKPFRPMLTCKKITMLFLSLVIFFLSACTTRPSPSSNSHTTIPLTPLSSWQTRTFNQQTQYSVIHEDNVPTIKAHSQASASMLYKAVAIDLDKTPVLHWQWKIKNTLLGINEQEKSGDDYPARIYIAVHAKPGSFYPRALNYVWSSTSPQGSQWQSPYSKSIAIIAKQSGKPTHGNWVSETVNLKKDLQDYFKEDFTRIKGIAIMSDTDNSQQEVTAYYRNIFFSP